MTTPEGSDDPQLWLERRQHDVRSDDRIDRRGREDGFRLSRVTRIKQGHSHLMHVVHEPLPGAKVIEFVCHRDERGTFTETYNRPQLAALGVDVEFVQDNESVSVHPWTIRGIHLQLPPHEQGKLVRVTSGAIADYAVDLRPTSPTYLQSCRVDLSGTDDLAFWIPPGFGHAFCTLEANSVVTYKVTSLYEPDAERSIRWDDPDLGLRWPAWPSGPVLSDRDSAAGTLRDLVG